MSPRRLLRSPRLRRMARCGAWAAVAVAVLWLALEITVALYPYALPGDALPTESLRVRDRDGELLGERVGPDGLRVRRVALDAVSPRLIEATLAIEDQRFFEHGGVDLRATARAILQNLGAGRVVSGASTITMQAVRLIEPHPKTLWHKLGEALDARRMERALDKRRILELYLGLAPYGGGTIGVEAASQRYFGKPAAQLTLAEAALLAGLPQGPSRLDPLRHPRRALARRARVLDRMRAVGRISAAEAARAAAEPLRLAQTPAPPRARHFTDALLALHGPRLAHGGDVRTTLDGSLQSDVQRLVRDHIESHRDRGMTNAAVVVLDNDDCAVRALVGSADYDRAPDGAVDGTRARRQPGSTLKPFAYALAFEQGEGPASIVADVPMAFDTPEGRSAPRNYDGRFHGPVMMGEALARSLNIPAIRVAEQVGPARLLDRLRRAGLNSLDHSGAHYGLGLVLGNGEVTPLELAQAYAAFARGGLGCRARLLPDGPAAGAERVFDRHVAALITDVLADDRLRMLAFGADNALMLGFPMAIKTGTSENWRDSWVAGYTDRHTVVVWAGDFAGRPMQGLSGVTGAGPLFARIARRVVGPPARRPVQTLARAAADPALRAVEVCPLSGRAPTAHCPAGRQVRVHIVPGTPGAAALEPDTWMRPVALDTRNGLRAGPDCPPAHVEPRVFAHLPPVYAEWQATAPHLPPPPTRYSPLCPAPPPPAPETLRITHPVAGDVFLLDPGAPPEHQRIALTARIDPPPPGAQWTVDGQPVAHADWPYTADWTLAAGRHTVQLVAAGRRSDAVVFEVR